MTEKMRLIPERLLRCLTPEGFVNEVRERICSSKNKFNAYEDVEADYEKHFGQRKYSDYGVFRSIESRVNKKLKQSK